MFSHSVRSVCFGYWFGVRHQVLRDKLFVFVIRWKGRELPASVVKCKGRSFGLRHHAQEGRNCPPLSSGAKGESFGLRHQAQEGRNCPPLSSGAKGEVSVSVTRHRKEETARICGEMQREKFRSPSPSTGRKKLPASVVECKGRSFCLRHQAQEGRNCPPLSSSAKGEVSVSVTRHRKEETARLCRQVQREKFRSSSPGT
jgi:hypothetical protein